MRVLLDTHVWLWWVSDPNRLSHNTLDLLRSRSTEVYFSAASGQEIAIKFALGRLSLPDPPALFIPPRLQRDGFGELPVRLSHSLKVADLPWHHRDPFDRLLVAQALLEGLTLISADRVLGLYPAPLHPA